MSQERPTTVLVAGVGEYFGVQSKLCAHLDAFENEKHLVSGLEVTHRESKALGLKDHREAFFHVHPGLPGSNTAAVQYRGAFDIPACHPSRSEQRPIIGASLLGSNPDTNDTTQTRIPTMALTPPTLLQVR